MGLFAGDGVGVEAPQFAQTSLKYLHLDHPLRRACIRSDFYMQQHLLFSQKLDEPKLAGFEKVPLLRWWLTTFSVVIEFINKMQGRENYLQS